MIFGHKRKNQAAIYLLNHWIHYERNFDSLVPAEVLNAKYLFSGLQKLDQEERLCLASQYRTARGKRYTDSEIADIKGVTVDEHREVKRGILDKFQSILIEIDEVLKNESDSHEVFTMSQFKQDAATQ